jgi:hypothetical protein
MSSILENNRKFSFDKSQMVQALNSDVTREFEKMVQRRRAAPNTSKHRTQELRDSIKHYTRATVMNNDASTDAYETLYGGIEESKNIMTILQIRLGRELERWNAIKSWMMKNTEVIFDTPLNERLQGEHPLQIVAKEIFECSVNSVVLQSCMYAETNQHNDLIKSFTKLKDVFRHRTPDSLLAIAKADVLDDGSITIDSFQSDESDSSLSDSDVSDTSESDVSDLSSA